MDGAHEVVMVSRGKSASRGEERERTMPYKNREITITVDPGTGQAEYKSEGFSGPSCTEPAEWARTMMGPPVVDDETEEFYQPVIQQQSELARRQVGGRG